MQTPRETILHLSLIPGIGPASVDALVRKESESFSLNDIYEYSIDELVKKVGLSAKTAELICIGLRDRKMLDGQLQLIEKHQIQWLTLRDSDYPELLSQVHLPPPIIYVRGSLAACHQKAVAFVGSRAANAYGRRVVEALVPELVAHGFAIVSGGALGIDTFAHQAAMHAGGQTVVVLGSGLLKPYPWSNKKLFDAVVATGGCIVSSFPLAMEALPGHFPARNRIISGLAKGSVVVQAAAKSGALITASYALNQGREVFAVPGSIDDPLTAGCHELIRQGATLVSSAREILESFGYVFEQEKDDKKSAKRTSVDLHLQTSVLQAQPLVTHEQQAIAPTLPADATPEDKIVFSCAQPMSFDELLNVSGLNFVELQSLLFDLQLEQKITQNGAGLWERV